MPEILIINEIKRRGQLQAVFISGRPEVILDSEILQKYSLQAGSEIEFQQWERIIEESDYKIAREYALRLLAGRAYSSGFLQSKMEKKGIAPKSAREVIRDLTEKGVLDDRKYAHQAVEALLRWKPAGRGYLISYLQTRQVPRGLAEAVVQECLRDVDEVELALRLLRPRRAYLAKFELETARSKAYNYLSRRGIGYHAAKQAFEKLKREET